MVSTTLLATRKPSDTEAGTTSRGPLVESSSFAATRKAKPGNRRRICETCREPKMFFDLARAPCRHEYCRDCLREHFEMSIRDDSLFPPRCCRSRIPVQAVRMFLTSDLVKSFEEKRFEFETPNKTYCRIPTCSKFIPPQPSSGDNGVCPNCSETTCTICKGAPHQGDCPQDAALQQVLATATAQGWQRCNSCRRVVELYIGCNHIT